MKDEILDEIDCEHCPMCSGKTLYQRKILGYDCKEADDCDEIVEQLFCQRRIATIRSKE